ncbi:signal peptidase I [Nocardioides daeguensis]|uniref:Signal peptidase I n=1 Tax=Nocardioides daeguensis TaxID=908359 RepID=A0ABP6VZ23_9ACTN|nr:signal peptidase I [Nocardioides daeguensis]MBV6726865.1 signal peptidase I [Nocardioides daeguensis]MCR1774383.1 signal peptidase I [Nocardioides daeguensis]
MAGWLGRVAAWLVILGVCAVLSVTVLIPRLAGATPYTVLTSSMTPDLPPGTLVVVRPQPASEIGLGDIITFQLESGKAPVATHRVVAVSNTPDGEPIFRTQGDANDAPDQAWVRPVQIKGRAWYVVPYLGHLNNLLTGRQRQMGVYLVAGALSAYAAYMFASALLGRSRRKEELVP